MGMTYGGQVMRSTDSGLTWPGAANGANLMYANTAGAAYGGAAGQIYVATPDGPMYSSDNGSTFALRVAGIQASDVADVISADDGTIYALQHKGQRGLWRRTTGSWTALDNAELLTHVPAWLDFYGFATSASDSSVIYVSDRSSGPIRSNNGGMDWTGPPPSFQTQSFGVTVDPNNPLIAYAVPAAGGLRRTVDGGLSYTNCGLIPAQFNVFRIDRAASNILYAAGGSPPNNRVYKSTDSCASWNPVGSHFALPTTDLAIDPANHNRVYVAGFAGVLRSSNGGTDWMLVDLGLGAGVNSFTYRVLIDPVLPTTLWVLNGGPTPGFGRSVDDGATWQWAASPLGTQGEFTAGVLDPQMPDTVVVGVTPWGLAEYQVAPDLQVSVEPAADASPGDTTSPWTIHVNNLGPWDSSAAVVVVDLPAGVTVSSPPAGCSVVTSTLSCELTRLRVNQVRDLTVNFTLPSASGVAQAQVRVEGHETDPVSSNDTASANLDVRPLADLAVEAPVGVLTVDRSQDASLQVTARNNGATTAANARVVFTLHPTLTPVSGSTPVGSCVTQSNQVVCSLGSVAAGASHALTLRFRGNVSGDASVSTQFTSDALDANSDQQGYTSVWVRKYFDLSTQLEVSPGAKQAGTAFQITATLRSDGDDLVTPMVSITLTGATATTAITNGGSCAIAGSVITCQTGAIGFGGTTTVQIAASAAAAGTVTIQAGATVDDGTDSNTANNTAALSTTVSAAPAAGGSPGKKKGGGGSFDWLALGLLGLLARRRVTGAA
jgi:hypothetical protein